MTRRRMLGGAIGMLASIAMPAVHGVEPPAPLLISISIDSYQTVQGVWVEMIYREAFRRIGQSISLQIVPSKRGTALLDSGQIDGELNRVAWYGDGHPQRLLVPEPHFLAVLTAYGRDDISLGSGWQSLANTPYRVEYRAGSVLAERELSKHVPAAQLSSVASAQLGLRKLSAGRTDLYVDMEMVVDAALATGEFQGRGIHPVAVMAKVGGHAYLHSRHARLVPLLAAALADMKKEGLVERYRMQAFRMGPPQSALAAPRAGIKR